MSKSSFKFGNNKKDDIGYISKFWWLPHIGKNIEQAMCL